MSTSHKHRFAPSKESETAVAAADTLVRVLFKEIVATGTQGNTLFIRFYDLVEKPFLDEMLKLCGGNASKAALMTGLHRETLRKLCRRYRIQAGRAK